MTDKVIQENIEQYNRDTIIGKLKECFETDKIALIPWDKDSEKFGHADGMVRFIDDQTVLLQGYFDKYDEVFKGKLYTELNRIGLRWEKILFDIPDPDERSWAYINFLQTKDLILIPSFGIYEDDLAFQQIEK